MGNSPPQPQPKPKPKPKPKPFDSAEPFKNMIIKIFRSGITAEEAFIASLIAKRKQCVYLILAGEYARPEAKLRKKRLIEYAKMKPGVYVYSDEPRG